MNVLRYAQNKTGEITLLENANQLVKSQMNMEILIIIESVIYVIPIVWFVVEIHQTVQNVPKINISIIQQIPATKIVQILNLMIKIVWLVSIIV